MTPYEKKLAVEHKGKQRKLFALMNAEINMRDALELAEHLKEIKAPSANLEHGMLTGIIVSYYRSFVHNEGVSSLPSKFSEFKDKKLAHVHDRAKTLRNEMFAHRDVSAEVSEGVKPDIIIVANSPADNKLRPMIARKVVTKEILDDLIALIKFQKDRLNESSKQTFLSIFKGGPLMTGAYRIDEQGMHRMATN